MNDEIPKKSHNGGNKQGYGEHGYKTNDEFPDVHLPASLTNLPEMVCPWVRWPMILPPVPAVNEAGGGGAAHGRQSRGRSAAAVRTGRLPTAQSQPFRRSSDTTTSE